MTDKMTGMPSLRHSKDPMTVASLQLEAAREAYLKDWTKQNPPALLLGFQRDKAYTEHDACVADEDNGERETTLYQPKSRIAYALNEMAKEIFEDWEHTYVKQR